MENKDTREEKMEKNSFWLCFLMFPNR